MSIDFSPIPQEINSVGDPALTTFKYYGIAGLLAEENPKFPFVDNDFVTSSSAEQELDEFGRTSVQLFLQGLYSIAYFTKQKDDPESELIYRADFIGISISETGGSDRIFDNPGNTVIVDESGSKGILISATTASNLQYLDKLVFDFDAAGSNLYYPDGVSVALEINSVSVNFLSPDGITVSQLTDGNISQSSNGTFTQSANALYSLDAGSVNIDATSGSVSIDASASSNFSTSSGNLKLESTSGNIDIQSSGEGDFICGGGLRLEGNIVDLVASSGLLNISSSGGLDVIGSGDLRLEGNTVDLVSISGLLNISSLGGVDVVCAGKMNLRSASNDVDILSDSGNILIQGSSSVTLDSGSTSVNCDGNNVKVDTPGVMEVTSTNASFSQEVLKLFKGSGAQNSDSYIEFSRSSDTSFIIMDSSGVLSFSASASDKRLKLDYSEIEGTLEKLAKVPVYSGLMKMPGDISIVLPWTYIIAEELQEEFPDLVEGDKDAVDSDGKPIYQQIKQDKQLILWAALRDAKIEIELIKEENEFIRNALSNLLADMGQNL